MVKNTLVILVRDYDKTPYGFFRMILLLLRSLEIKQPFLIVKMSAVRDVFCSEKSLNADTRLIRTLWNVPLVFLINRVPLK